MPQLVKLAQNGFISLESQKINDTSYIITYDGANFDAMVKGRCVESSNQVVI
jgi:Na+-transporting NADH:ubiquinone oxidoreductase subunit NqrA